MTQDACSESVRNGRHRRVLVGLLHLGHRNARRIRLRTRQGASSSEPSRLDETPTTSGIRARGSSTHSMT
jgi:hypothetical protein